jgi:hypothetical protein
MIPTWATDAGIKPEQLDGLRLTYLAGLARGRQGASRTAPPEELREIGDEMVELLAHIAYLSERSR